MVVRVDNIDADHPEFPFTSGLRGVRVKPLMFSTEPPSKPGWWYVRRKGEREYTTYWVEDGVEFFGALEWAGPLPEPYG